MATIRKRNGKWQAQVRKVGHEPISRTFLARVDAQRWAKSVERDIDVGDLPRTHTKERHTLREALHRYRDEVIPTKRSYSTEDFMIRVIERFDFVDLSFGDLRPSHLASFRDIRLKEAKPATVLRQMRVFLHILKVAKQEWGWNLDLEAFALVRKPSVEISAVARISDEELQKFLMAARNQARESLALSTVLALTTGMRRSEILNLQWADVDLVQKRILVRKSKNGRPRMIPIAPLAVEALEKSQRSAGAVIFATTNSLRLSFQRAKKKAGTAFKFHDLRHEAISRFFELGLTAPEAQMMSGHRTLSQLSRYSHADADRIARKFDQ